MSRDYDFINSISDEPIEIYDNDSLSMQKQINGLSRYLSTCSCPLTVSIQGSWGSGKTSFFNMVRNKLENNQNNNCLFVEFNAWQYSQFSKDANLPVSLFASITNQIKKEISDDNPYINDNYIQDSKYLDTLKTVISFIGTVGNRYAEKKFGFNILSEKKKFQEEREEFNKLMNGVNAISKLQNDFKQFVEEALEKKFKKLDDKSRRNSRIIVFIDDLDRLLPEKAVDLLDIIKIFLDCPRCVFVLAVDYDVIINGVEKKYNNTITKEKANDYFEKMIQVVYRLPQKMASMKEYIRGLLEKLEINTSITDELSKLISAASKDTPRNVKRLINNYYLIKLIDDTKIDNITYHNSYDVYLFAVMLLREVCNNKYLELYSSLNNLNDKIEDLFTKNIADDTNIENEYQRRYIEAFKNSLSNYNPSRNNLYDVLDNPDISFKEYLEFDFSICDTLKTAIKALNYSGESTTIVKEVKITSNQFNIMDCGIVLKNEFKKETSKGTVGDAYKVTISLIAGLCTKEGLEKLCHQIDFASTHNFQFSEETVYQRHIKEYNSLFDPEDVDTDSLELKYQGKIYIKPCSDKDRCIERIQKLADILKLTIYWDDNIVFKSADKDDDGKSTEDVDKKVEYLDFGFLELSQLSFEVSIEPLMEKNIISLYDLSELKYDKLLKMYDNDKDTVDKLIEEVAKYGVFIQK